METNCLMMDASDNVAVCTKPISAGEKIVFFRNGEEQAVIAQEAIPIWHKVALKQIHQGGPVLKYGQVIGKALQDIPAGGWVSHKNICGVPRDYRSEMIE